MTVFFRSKTFYFFLLSAITIIFGLLTYIYKLIDIPNEVTFFIILAFLLYFGMGWKLLCQSVELTNVLNSLLKNLKESRNNHINFKEDIKDVFEDAKYKGKSFLQDYWREFDETLEVDKKANRVFNTIQSEDFFTKNSLINHNIDWHSLILSTPGILTSIGLLGTFVAILMGLHHVTVEASGAVSGIEGLINGLAGKFVSSIVALFLSIIFIFIEKIQFAKLHSVCFDIQTELNKLFPRKSTAKILLDILEHNEEQSASLKSFSTDMSGHLKGAVQEGIAPLVESLLQAVEEIKCEKQQSSTQAISEMINQFQSSLTGAAGKEIEALASSMSDITTTFSSFDNNNKAFEERVQSVISNLDSVIKHQQDQFIEYSQKIAEINSTQFEQFKNLVSDVDEKFTSFSELLEKNNKVQQALDKVVGEMAYTGEQFNESSEAFKNINNAVNQLVSTSENYQDQFSESVRLWNTQQQSIKDLEASLGGILKNVQSSLVSYSNQTNNSLTEYLAQYDQQMADSTRYMASTIQDLDDKLDTLNEIFNTKLESVTVQIATQEIKAENEEQKVNG